MKKQQNPKPPEGTVKPQAPPGPPEKMSRSEVAKEWWRIRKEGKVYKKKKKRYDPLVKHNAHEGQRHLDAFEYYYMLGDNRSLSNVATHCKVSIPTAKNWSTCFNWQLRVEQRDVEINRQYAKKLINSIAKTKADYRQDIKAAFSTVKFTLMQLVNNMKTDPNTIKVKDVSDLNTLMTALDKLTRLDLTLLGEDRGDLAGLPQTFSEFAAACVEKWTREGKDVSGVNGNSKNGKNGKKKGENGKTD